MNHEGIEGGQFQYKKHHPQIEQITQIKKSAKSVQSVDEAL
jgi:hypothetical protein